MKRRQFHDEYRLLPSIPLTACGIDDERDHICSIDVPSIPIEAMKNYNAIIPHSREHFPEWDKDWAARLCTLAHTEERLRASHEVGGT